MNRSRVVDYGSRDSVPRRRGDEPDRAWPRSQLDPAVPRRRGDEPRFTVPRGLPCSPQALNHFVTVADLGQLFPAGAGMNRIRAVSTTGPRTVPRRRGDEPPQEPPRCFDPAVPRRRGDEPTSIDYDVVSQPVPRRRGDEPIGTPASLERSSTTVPRRRGDEPDGRGSEKSLTTCSPQARG